MAFEGSLARTAVAMRVITSMLSGTKRAHAASSAAGPSFSAARSAASSGAAAGCLAGWIQSDSEAGAGVYGASPVR